MTDTLAAALGRGYRVERELGQVAAAIGAERFLRQGDAVGEPTVVPTWEAVVRARTAAGR